MVIQLNTNEFDVFDELIKDVGEQITLERSVSGGRDPATNKPLNTVTTFSAWIADGDTERGLRDKTLASINSRTVILYTRLANPVPSISKNSQGQTVSWALIDSSAQRWTINKVSPYRARGEDIACSIEISRG